MHEPVRIGRMSFLSNDDKLEIYGGALSILAQVGMVVHDEEATTLLAEAGCRVAEGGLVFVPPHVVERARESVPAVVSVYDRDGEPAMELGHHNSYFGTGSDLMWTYDLETGAHRESCLEDVARASRLADALPNIDFVMSSAYPNEVGHQQAYIQSLATMIRNTTKPIVAVAENRDDLSVMRDLAAAVRGGPERLRLKPYIILYIEPTSPLQHPPESIEKLLLCADAGIPAIYCPAPMTGATAPITVAGYMAQGTAESLFGLVVHQLFHPGAPFVFGHGHAVLDMRTAQSTYNSVEGYLCEMGMVEMAKWLDIPNFGNAGTSDSQLVDAQAGIDISAETLLVMQAGSNLNHNAGYLDFGLTGSLEGIVITDEVISMNRRLLAGIVVDPDTLALDVIATVGPGGHFLGQRHTRRHLRRGQWRPSILNRDGRAAWVEGGEPDLRARARDKAIELLRESRPAPLALATSLAMDRLLAKESGGRSQADQSSAAAARATPASSLARTERLPS